jgi:hypothetical protein
VPDVFRVFERTAVELAEASLGQVGLGREEIIQSGVDQTWQELASR